MNKETGKVYGKLKEAIGFNIRNGWAKS